MDFRPLEMWNIYNKPSDHPESVIARKWLIANWYGPSGCKATDEVIIAPTLEEVRAMLPPGLICITRAPDDEAQIVESWF